MRCAQCDTYDHGCEKLADRLIVYEKPAATIPHPIPANDRARFITPHENKARLDSLRPPR